MKILGLNTYHADTSACILIDGKLIAACEEERFSRIKHFSGFPINSIKYCLKKTNLKISDIDYISVNFNLRYNINQRIKFLLSNLKSSSLVNKLLGLINKKNIADLIYENFGENVKDKIQFIPHHISHISSSYFTSGLETAVGLSVDATGDFSSMEISKMEKNKIKILAKNYYPHSLGILYQSISQFLGFKKYGDEYKVMALAAYGKPNYKKEFEKLIKFLPPYNFELNLNYFVHQKKFFFDGALSNEPYFENLYSRKMEELLGKPREYQEDMVSRHYDIAASLQNRFEQILLKIINNIYLENHSDSLCLSGGCIFNSVLNGKIYQLNKFKDIFIHANVGDAGGAVGSALFCDSKFNKKKYDKFENYYLGPNYCDDDVELALNKNKNILLDYEINKIDNYDTINDIVTDIISKKGVVAWFQDSSEWGPRALGNRSILVDCREPDIKDILNTKIKLREKFRPFAASILEDDVSDFFIVNDKKDKFPNMNFVLKAKEITQKTYPSIVHVDGSSRIQSVNIKSNKKFYDLLKKFKDKFSCPMLLNTSMNIDEPICESPTDVINSFANTKIDCIVMQKFILKKKTI